MPTHFNNQEDLYGPTMKPLQFLQLLDKSHGCSCQTADMLRYSQQVAVLKPAKGSEAPL